MPEMPYVLMLESDSDDLYFTEATLSEIGSQVPVKFVSNSNDLIGYLATEWKPSLILLSHNAYPLNALELMKQIKNNPEYSAIPVVILSENLTPEYVRYCYRSGANSVITKPSSVEGTQHKIRTFLNYWFQVVELGT